MATIRDNSRFSLFLHTGMVALAYFAGARLGLSYAVVGGAISLVWPSSGIALVALLALGIEVAPGIAVGSFLANVSAGVPAAVAAAIGIGSMAGTLTAALLLNRAARFRITFERINDVLAFIALAAVMSTAVSALVGTTALLGGGLVRAAGYAAAFLKWWLGDMMGVLVVAPALFGFLTYSNPVRSMQRAVEACGLIAATLWVSYLIFGAPQLAGHGYYPAALAIFPFIIWAALRFDRLGASIVTLMVSLVAIWGTTHGTGPFAAESPVDSLVRWCAFANVVAVTGLLLAAARAQEQVAHDLLQAARIELERRVEERTEDLEKANNELKEEMARRRLLEGELIRIGDQQQRLIGQELHDGLGQHLTSLGLYCAALNQKLKTQGHPSAADAAIVVGLVKQASLMTRRIAHGLDPVAMEYGGLADALRALAETARALNGVDCKLRIAPDVDLLDPLLQINLYRAAQEAVNNALKYCHGHRIWIDLERAGGLQTLSISDDGVGIGPEEMERASGLGLHNLRHRASLLGGSCTVTRNGLGGTTVAISYPLPEGTGRGQEMR
ncbi:MASE1 domain-containing protein [Paraburkholderia silvatlantica]|uniref:histidine kinase n=1 Tax=Paraburkholderia silvatlantica TaxID=321895 RepID=A0A2U1A0X6_9BURK|nr:MASE1 domain-containing protein [Paraburkholderia silvatlantica]MBB2926488.1 signal transduction histidine kinase [Paraburkholderia silvatlantica]PVY25083.1 signal transduction histidine kinase [Paraburkholderia silvatlantica]PXW30167.1 signal transduction histidine kinase [Paraburkholderia silvatlantica]PYE16734.1 signal transduction histidine kinase [Paraburkholderia silvatlantica]